MSKIINITTVIVVIYYYFSIYLVFLKHKKNELTGNSALN